jgi:hypothetical protein
MLETAIDGRRESLTGHSSLVCMHPRIPRSDLHALLQQRRANCLLFGPVVDPFVLNIDVHLAESMEQGVQYWKKRSLFGVKLGR